LNNIVTMKSGLEVTQYHSNWCIQKLGCSLIFAIYRNYGDILCRLQDIASYWWKIVKFLYTTCIYHPHMVDSIGISRRCLILILEKLEWLGYRAVKKLWQYVSRKLWVVPWLPPTNPRYLISGKWQ